MKNESMEWVEKQIGYVFKSEVLLRQSLTRKAYANEHPEYPHNEVMEHCGDTTVKRVIKAALRLKYTYINEEGQFISILNEQAFTEKTAYYESNATLAAHVDRMGLTRAVFLGCGEKLQNCMAEEKPKADLFEAIAFAVELDCGEDFETVKRVVLHMMGITDPNEI